MTKSPILAGQHNSVALAILAVMQEVSYIQKERKQGVQYPIKSERSVIVALRDSMINNGLVMYPTSVSDTYHERYDHTNARGKTTSMARVVASFGYCLHHAHSDTMVHLQTMGEGVDNGDKAGNKAMTVSKKYALLEAFLIETGNDPDNTSSDELKATPKKKPAPKPVPKKKVKAQAGGELQKGPAPKKKPTIDPLWEAEKVEVAQRTWTNPQKDAVIEAGAASNRDVAQELLDRSTVQTLDKASIVGSWARKFADSMFRSATADGSPDVNAAIIFADEALAKHKESK